ncbi:hypothetical protein [Clostridium phage Amboise]|nr:hypothetical protein [Clostridium phage Amboise]
MTIESATRTIKQSTYKVSAWNPPAKLWRVFPKRVIIGCLLILFSAYRYNDSINKITRKVNSCMAMKIKRRAP